MRDNVKKYPDGTNIQSEVEEFVRSTGSRYKTNGDEYVLEYCPFCHGGRSGDTNTFAINYKTGQYSCLRGSCEAKGNLWTLTKNDDFDYSLPEPEKKEARRHTHSFKVSAEHDERAAEWIERNRGIPKEVTYKYKVAFGTERFKRIYNERGDMVLAHPEKVLIWQFTNPSGEKTLWYKFRKTEGEGSKEWSIPNKFIIGDYSYTVEPCLFGMGECDYVTSTIIMTEGQFDALAVSAAGFGNVVSVPTGKTGFKWFDESDISKDFLYRFDELIIFGDREGDEISLLEPMKERYKGKIKHVRIEDYKDCKDANDILRKYGTEQIKVCIENAQEIVIKNVKKMREIKRVNMAELPRLSTGIEKLDEYILGFFYGQLITLTGESGDGKTTFASQIATFIINQHVPTVIYSGEISEWMVKEWMMFQIAGPHNLIGTEKGVMFQDGIYDKIVDWENFGDECMVYSSDDIDMDDFEDDGKAMLATIKETILRQGVKFIIIDNLMTAMTFSADGDLNKSQSAFVKQLKFVAKAYNVIILLIAHPRKDSKTLSKDSLFGSSNIANLSDTIISYSKPKGDDNGGSDHQREIKLLKNRWNNEKGVGEVINTFFDETSKRISMNKSFDWSLEWETNFHNVQETVDLDVIPE